MAGITGNHANGGGFKTDKNKNDKTSGGTKSDASKAMHEDNPNKVGSNSFTSGTDSEGHQGQRQDSTPQNGGVGNGRAGSGTPERIAGYEHAVDDYNNTDNTPGENFWTGLANFFGIREQNPMVNANVDDPNSPFNTGNADWGANTAGILGGLAGGAVLPGLGLLTGPIAGAINDDLGQPIPDINLGQLGSKPVDPNAPAHVGADISGGDTNTDPGAPTDSNNGADRTGQSDAPGAATDVTGSEQAVAPPVKKTPADLQDGSQDTILPQTGIGISIPTQTSGAGSSVYVGTPDQRRRRGSLGGLGRSGLAL